MVFCSFLATISISANSGSDPKCGTTTVVTATATTIFGTATAAGCLPATTLRIKSTTRAILDNKCDRCAPLLWSGTLGISSAREFNTAGSK